jgi:fatty acid elongase 2/fatty acid elongase 3
MPNAGHCAGEEFAAFAGMGILSSYLLLFISFYIATYKTTGRPRARKAARSLKDAQIPDVAALTKGKLHPHENGSVKNGSVTTSAHTPNGNGHITRSRKA